MNSCVLCREGRVAQQLTRMAFRQWSDKGYIHCEAMVVVHVCDSCGMKTLDGSADKIMDEAFQREYRTLRR